VLGGGLEYRPFIAADLYKKGLVSKVLVSQVPKGQVGALLGHNELNRKALLKLGVPDAAIEIFGMENRSTEDEGLALKDWAEKNAPLYSLCQAKSSLPVAYAGFFTGSFAGHLCVSRFHPLRRTLLVQGGGRRKRV